MTTKNTYRIIDKIDTYATVEVQADSLNEALRIAATDDDLDWSYETDYDSAVTITWDLIEEGTPEDLMGVEFVDPYLGRDDVIWEVNAYVGDGMWQAEIVTADEDHDEDLGVMDLYGAEHIKANRIVR
jgi:hypothetical protein